MDIIAVIVAAGRGTRAGGDAPKQYRLLDRETVLARTISKFAGHEGVDAVLPVIHGDDHERYASVSEGFSSKLLPPVEGGATRQASVYAGLQALQDVNPAHVLIHDAARPFTSARVISGVIAALPHHDGAVPAMTIADTLKRIENGLIVETVDRRSFIRAQTPQGFAFKKLLEAHEKAAAMQADGFTDDASLAEWYGLDITVVEGDEKNFKLTSNEDFEFAEAMLQRSSGGQMSAIRIGQGFDVHAFANGDHVVLGGIKISHDKGLAGHSDADVVLHALTDALLGAIGDGDIGTHFPPSDPQWRGASSDLFLRDAGRRVRERNGEIANADVTIICETPKIGPHSKAMRKRIAEILELDVDRVSVKATTTEGLGFTGRGEGIAAQAAVLVRFA